MSQESIIFPLIAMVALTVAISVYLLKSRYRAVLEDGLDPRYFKQNSGADLPDYLVRVTQHYENLFEMPMLFYVVCILLFITQNVDIASVVLAWGYFFSRIVHAYIHIGKNRLLQRRNSFFVSSLFLLALWVWLCIKLLIHY